MKTLLLFLLCINLSAFESINWPGTLSRFRADEPITWSSTLSPANTALARACFQQWSDATDGLLTFVEGGDGILLRSQGLDKPAGEMYLNRYDEAGYFTSANVVLNTTLPDGSELTHCILLHEIGHALGMGHADGTWPGLDLPTMYPSQVTLGQATLHADDINGVRYIYGLCARPAAPLQLYATKLKGHMYSVMASEADEFVAFTAPKKNVKFALNWVTNLGPTLQANPALLKLRTASAKVEAYWNGQYGTVILGKQPKVRK